MTNVEGSRARVGWGQWIGVGVCGCTVAVLAISLTAAYEKLASVQARVDSLERKMALIDALSTDTLSPYREYVAAMQGLRQQETGAPTGGERSEGNRLGKIDDRLDGFEDRLGDLLTVEKKIHGRWAGWPISHACHTAENEKTRKRAG